MGLTLTRLNDRFISREIERFVKSRRTSAVIYRSRSVIRLWGLFWRGNSLRFKLGWGKNHGKSVVGFCSLRNRPRCVIRWIKRGLFCLCGVCVTSSAEEGFCDIIGSLLYFFLRGNKREAILKTFRYLKVSGRLYFIRGRGIYSSV